MVQVLIYVHVLAAIFMGIYLILPFLAARVERLSNGSGQAGFLHVLFAANRSAQYAAIISFLSGGYLVSKQPYSVAWMVLAVVLFLAIAAISGILGKRMKLALADNSGSGIKQQIGSIKTLSTITGVLFFLIVTLMKFPYAF